MNGDAMNNMALYRKYRPKTFDEVYGQTAVLQTLRNQIRAGKPAHAYLFYGLKGSGKTSVARILARAVNCLNTIDGNPCNKCSCCVQSNSVNPDIIEIDAASNNGVDNVRSLIDEVNYKPINSKYKVYIIDEVHMLSTSAFNALLKTIEEPPSHVIFIFATTEFAKVPDTIKSRCQIYNFKQLSEHEIVDALQSILNKENNNCFDEECLRYIASKSEGSLRDAVSILDQCISISDNKVTIQDLISMFGDIDGKIIEQISNCIDDKNIIKAIDIIHEQYYNGRSLRVLFDGLYKYYFKLFSDGDETKFQKYGNILSETIFQIDKSDNKMLMAETAIIKMCTIEDKTEIDLLKQEIKHLKSQISHITIHSEAVADKMIDTESIIYYNKSCGNIITIS